MQITNLQSQLCSFKKVVREANLFMSLSLDYVTQLLQDNSTVSLYLVSDIFVSDNPAEKIIGILTFLTSRKRYGNCYQALYVSILLCNYQLNVFSLTHILVITAATSVIVTLIIFFTNGSI